MVVILDNGHGVDTKGKCSPDGRLREYAYARDIARRVKKGLEADGVKCILLVPEENDIELRERVRRVNELCKQYGAKNCILVSIHNNAAGNGSRWLNARGWQVHVSRNASVNSKRLAVNLFFAAQTLGCKVRRPDTEHPYWTQNLMICRDTNCPAVLTENFFQDNTYDVEWLLSDEGRETVTRIHVDGILAYIR